MRKNIQHKVEQLGFEASIFKTKNSCQVLFFMNNLLIIACGDLFPFITCHKALFDYAQKFLLVIIYAL